MADLEHDTAALILISECDGLKHSSVDCGTRTELLNCILGLGVPVFNLIILLP